MKTPHRPHPASLTAVEIVRRFNDALNARDLIGMMQWLTPDTVFENTYPPPDGARYAGQAAVRAFWEDFFHGSAQAHFDIEEIFALGERCVMRWTYSWTDTGGRAGHIQGIDVYRIRDGLIAEKLSYVKG